MSTPTLKERFNLLQSSCYKRFSELLSGNTSYNFFNELKDVDLEEATMNSLLPYIAFTIESNGKQSFEYVLEVTSDGEIHTVKEDDYNVKRVRKFSDVNDVYYMIELIEAMEEFLSK